MNDLSLKKSFKMCFDENGYFFSDGEDHIFAAPKKISGIENNDSCIHYELLNRENLFFVEFHIETNAYPEFVELLYKQFNKNENLRKYKFETYYGSKYWITRTPVFSEEDVKNDVEALKAIITGHTLPPPIQSSHPMAKSQTFVDRLNACRCFTEKLSILAANNEINIPDVQRGFVWNSARCATLWDSILRGFPIGSLCFQINAQAVNLLDGQQRLTAIKLAFAKFPPPDTEDTNKKQSILWLDLGGTSNYEKKFAFKVTTASQPWGHKDSNKETENPKLSVEERKNAVNGYKWHGENVKPYPFELFPFQSDIPVPFTLLREWLWTTPSKTDLCFDNFKKFCTNKLAQIKYSDNWLNFIENKSPDENTWTEIIEAVQKLKDYEIVVTNASNVVQEDISLFFARIGRGGVVPTEEEVAYSILKAKIGNGFKKKIEYIAQNGYAPAYRIANLAIRCFCSEEKHLCRTSVFDEVQKLCGNDGGKEKFIYFVDKEFEKLFASLTKFLKEKKLTAWHISRYCNYANGDIFLYLLCELKEKKDIDDAIIRVAEYIHCFSSDPGQVLGNIRKSGIEQGIIASLGTTYRGKPILNMPIPIAPYSTLAELKNFATIRQWLNNPSNRTAADLLRYGYDKPQMYSILLFACNEALPNFDPYLDEWKDENCPWDYDHILPKNWFEKMKGQNADVCRELKNSIGNLAPLDFSLNRSLSNGDRPDYYPKKEYKDNLLIAKNFQGYAKADFENIDNENKQLYFCQTTINRFIQIYKKWNEAFKLNFDNIIKNSFRYNLFQTIKKELSVHCQLQIYYVDGELQYKLGEDATSNFNWLRPWLSIGVVKEDCFIAISCDLDNNVECGYRRHPQKSTLDGKNIWYLDKEYSEAKIKNLKDNKKTKLIDLLSNLVKSSNNH